MKRLLYILFVFVLLCSCRSQKNTINVVEETAWERQSHIRDSVQREYNKKSEEEWWEYVEQEIEEEKRVIYYDTTKPVDSVTGKQPVLKEEIITRKSKNKTEQSNTNNIEEAEIVTEISDSVDSLSYISTTETKIVEVKKESILGKLLRWIVMIYMLIGTTVVSIYIYRILK